MTMLKFGFVDINESTRNMDFIELNIFKDRLRNVSDMHVMMALSEMAGWIWRRGIFTVCIWAEFGGIGKQNCKFHL